MSLISTLSLIPVKITTFTSSGTWTKDPRTKAVIVKVVGGGGGRMNGTNGASGGGTSSFGSFCSATGGAGSSLSSEGSWIGGSGIGGDINIDGASGVLDNDVTLLGYCSGFSAIGGQYGKGAVTGGSGGGGGGYAEKLILNPGNTEAVTVGAGGSSGGVNPGNNGVVIVYEFK